MASREPLLFIPPGDDPQAEETAGDVAGVGLEPHRDRGPAAGEFGREVVADVEETLRVVPLEGLGRDLPAVDQDVE